MKKNIALVYGGYSKENEISRNTSNEIIQNLDKELFNVYTISINKHQWVCEDFENDIKVDKNDFSLKIDNEQVTFDAVFIAIHGTPGENGLLQGYFDMLSIPYTTCNSFTSSLTFNKAATKMVVKNYNIPTAKFVLLRKGEDYSVTDIIDALKLPIFVKPNNGGSSFGVSKVKNAEEITDAIEKAFIEDDEIIIEEFIVAREVTCGVYCSQNHEIILPITEICTKNEFFDFEAKYKEGLTEEITPADLSIEQSELIKKMSLDIYKILNCKGLVRIDYLLSDNIPYFMEINTVPGMSKESIVPKQLKTYGLELSDFYTMVINDILN